MPNRAQNPMTQAIDVGSINSLGREAFASGKDWMDNPFFCAEHMPRRTGDSFERWQDKIEAWEAGWQAAAAEKPARHRGNGESARRYYG